MGPEQPLTVRDLFQAVSIGSNAIEWVQEKLFTNNAASQNGEGTAKAESGLTFEKKTSPVETIAWDGDELALNDTVRVQPLATPDQVALATFPAPTGLRTIGQTGLSHRTHTRVSELAHGERRQLELAMALAQEASVLLLDEPMAGMGAEESARMTDLLQSLKGRDSILLVEHDMDAVFALADQLTVMVNGQVIASGTPTAVRNDPVVQAAYLGDEH